MDRKKLLIITLVMLGIVNLRLRNSIVRRMICKIYKKHGILLSFKKVRIDRRFGLVAERIYFKKRPGLRAIIISFSLRVSLRFRIKYVRCGAIDIAMATPAKTGSKATTSDPPGKPGRIVRRLVRQLQTNTVNRLGRRVQSFNASYVSLKYYRENAKAELFISKLARTTHLLRIDKAHIKYNGAVIAETGAGEMHFKRAQPNGIHTTGRLINAVINFPLFSTEPVTINQIDWSAEIKASKESITISRQSSFSINNIPVLAELHVDLLQNNAIKCSFIIIIKGNTFFKNYPFFHIKELNTVEASGELVLQIIYVHNLQNISESYFRTKVIKDDLHIEAIDQLRICNISGDFAHAVKKNGKTLREIQISDSDPGFLKFNCIPKTLTGLVILTEDPGFYEHKGIDAYNIQQAILTNLKQGKFSRGASTITMQLVRNLFLGHHKNICRKLEEFIIAWLLEKHVSITKERILEIYLNIIEFGDNVYGIGEAAHYYFGKTVHELSVTEQLVLTYIIPRPGFFLDALLAQSNQLRQRLKQHISYYAEKLSAQKIIAANGNGSMPVIINFKPEFGSLCLE